MRGKGGGEGGGSEVGGLNSITPKCPNWSLLVLSYLGLELPCPALAPHPVTLPPSPPSTLLLPPLPSPLYSPSSSCCCSCPCSPLSPFIWMPAGRMDAYVDSFQAAGGSLIMLAKGNRSKAVTTACKKHGGFYLGSIGECHLLIYLLLHC